MLKNVLIAAVAALGFTLTSAPALAYVYVQVGPPAPIVETVPARPGSGYVWVPGYYRWGGGRYVWVHGSYVRHAGAWCGGHWHHNHHGYYWTEGRWC